MSTQLKAGIPPDQLGQKTLAEISAADFLTALNAGGPSPLKHIHLWPEKKKVEYELEPQDLGKVRVGVIVQIIGEKKKVELEKDIRSEIPFKWLGEGFPDPRALLGDPTYIAQVAREVANQLKSGR